MKYFPGADKPEQRCAERVFQSRQSVKESGKEFSLGVEPTVGLGAALLIFFGVGVFAAGIAQAFQLVSKTLSSSEKSIKKNCKSSYQADLLNKLLSLLTSMQC